MSNAAQIIEALGGTVAVARALQLTPSTVSSWKSSGRIPAWRQRDIRQLAQEQSVDLHGPLFSGAAADKSPGKARGNSPRPAAAQRSAG